MGPGRFIQMELSGACTHRFLYGTENLLGIKRRHAENTA